jgi:hypothetical protein
VVFVLWAQLRAESVHPARIVVASLLLALVVSTVVLAAAGGWRLLRRPGRVRTAAWLVLGVFPLLLLGLPADRARRGWDRREAPAGTVARLVTFGGVALMEADARLRYPYRVETGRLIMFHSGVPLPDADAAAMDQHVAAIEAEVGRPLREKIWWVRGTALGQGGLSAHGVALGGDGFQAGREDLLTMDRHELAHAVMNQHQRP